MAGQTLNSLKDLFVVELNDILDAEQQITKALPKMIDAASSSELKQKFQQHLEQTNNQIDRLQKVFKMMNINPEPEHCDGMAGIIKEGEKMLMVKGDPLVKDAALIESAQKVEHYEISTYGTLRTFAETLGFNDVAQLLQTTLKEETSTDKLLTQVAEQSINKKAA